MAWEYGRCPSPREGESLLCWIPCPEPHHIHTTWIYSLCREQTLCTGVPCWHHGEPAGVRSRFCKLCKGQSFLTAQLVSPLIQCSCFSHQYSLKSHRTMCIYTAQYTELLVPSCNWHPCHRGRTKSHCSENLKSLPKWFLWYSESVQHSRTGG